MTAEDRISAEEIAYSYGDLLAVDHTSFRVGEGEILGFRADCDGCMEPNGGITDEQKSR